MHGKTPHELALAADGARCARLITGLIDLEVFYETHPGAPVPDRPVLSIRVPDGPGIDRVAAVDAIAEALGVHTQLRHGCYMAMREFGPLLLEAHYTPAATIAEIAGQIRRGEVHS